MILPVVEKFIAYYKLKENKKKKIEELNDVYIKSHQYFTGDLHLYIYVHSIKTTKDALKYGVIV